MVEFICVDIDVNELVIFATLEVELCVVVVEFICVDIDVNELVGRDKATVEKICILTLLDIYIYI